MKPALKASEEVQSDFCLRKTVRKEILTGQKPQLPEHTMGLGGEEEAGPSWRWL